MPLPVEKPTVRRIFDRLNTDQNDHIDRDETVAYLRRLGISGMVASPGADDFMSKLGSNGRGVTWSDFVRHGPRLLPPGLTNAAGQPDPERVARVFDRMARGGKTKVSEKDLAKYIQPSIKGGGLRALFAGTIAGAMAKVAVDALDTDGDRAFTRQDLADLLDDFNRQLGSL